MVVQIFPADLLASVCIHSVLLPDDDIRNNSSAFSHKVRVGLIEDALISRSESGWDDAVRESFFLTANRVFGAPDVLLAGRGQSRCIR